MDEEVDYEPEEEEETFSFPATTYTLPVSPVHYQQHYPHSPNISPPPSPYQSPPPSPPPSPYPYLPEWTKNEKKKKKKKKRPNDTRKIVEHVPTFPIYSETQGYKQSKTYLEVDTQSRIVLPIQLPISSSAKQIYEVMESETIKTLMSNIASRCPTATPETLRASRQATFVCCGYSAPVMTCIIYLLQLYNSSSSSSSSSFNINKFLKQIDNVGIIFNNEDESMEISNMPDLYKRINRFFLLISGYAKFSQEIGWNKRCSDNYTLVDGLNLVTIFEPHIGITTCSTYHHFVVYCINKWAIIYDSWAGGEHGCREGWTRIMKMEDMQKLINIINNLISSRKRTEIFRKYFNAPDKKGTYKFEQKVQVGILNGPKLNNYLWTYLYGKDSGLINQPAIDVIEEHGFGLKRKQTKKRERTRMKERTRRKEKQTKKRRRKSKRNI